MSKIGLIEDCVNKLKFGKEIYMDIKEVLSRPEYSFIQANPHLGGSMLFVTFGGSHAYGTNKPTSDIDTEGIISALRLSHVKENGNYVNGFIDWEEK